MKNDIYLKLKPALPTPKDGICSCKNTFPFELCYAFFDNPIRCIECNLEVLPENLPFETPLIDEIASWNTFYSCFFNLWLDSGEFEDWACQQLSDPQSVANQRAYSLCTQISEIRKCYFWWFQDTGADDFTPLATCPKCHSQLIEKYDRLICEQCSILIAN